MNDVVDLDKIEKQKEWNRRKEWVAMTKEAKNLTCSVELSVDEWIIISIALDLILKSEMLATVGFVDADFKKSIESALRKLDVDKLLISKDD